MKKNKKGFTLAELLIVVAIIAVLVAIAIPVLNSSLEKSRQAADAANIRAAYAQAVTNMMVDNTVAGTAVTQATMKTGGAFTKLNEGDTLAGVPFNSIASVHIASNKVAVVVTVSEVKFYTATASGVSTGKAVVVNTSTNAVTNES